MRFALIFLAGISTITSAVAGDLVAPVSPVNCYLPYGYPALGSCPCGEDFCFRPTRYYSCDDGYEKSFWRRWLRAHFCGASMLEGIPCHCLPPSARATGLSRAPLAVPPAPSPLSE